MYGNLGPAGGGGIIRDERGCVLVGYTSSYGVFSNRVAEGRALLDGLHLAQQLGIQKVLIELNMQVIVNWLKFGVCTLWYMWNFWEDIRELFWLLDYIISHIFREANMVVDHLAKEGANGKIKTITGKNVGPSRLRGLLRTDYLELSYLRLKS